MPSVRPYRVYLPCVGLVLALLLWFYAPTLRDGLFADDFVAMAIMEGKFAAPRSPLDLFNFANGTPEDVRALRRLGSLPWWAPDDYRIAFMRPMSSAAWQLDRLLFGKRYGWYHAHSLAVFFALVVSASLLYRRLFAASVGLLATLIFAVDDSLQFPVLWLSNRGGIYALFFGALALHSHLEFRERKRPAFAALSAVSISVGLLFGEWAIPMLAYIVAYELVAAEGGVKTRGLALLPTVVPGVVFLLARALLHYGARGSGAYVDPGNDPVRFVLSVTHRIPVFFADMLWNVPSEWWDHGTPWRDRILSLWLIPPGVWMRLPSWHFFQLLLGAAAFAALGLALYFCRAGLTPEERRNVRFLLLGAVGALVPVVGSFPSSRLTIAAFMGVSPVFALLMREVARKLAALTAVPTASFAGKLLGYTAIVAAVIHFQIYSPLQADIQARVDHYATAEAWALAAPLDARTVAGKRLFLLSASEFTTTFFFAYIWSHAGMPLPRSYAPISVCPCAHQIIRTADNELELRALGAPYLASGEENMFQSPDRLWAEGETVELEELSVHAEKVVDGHPLRLRLTFERSLDDPTYIFMASLPIGLARWFPPPVGEQVLLQRSADPSWPALERHRAFLRIEPIPEMLHYGSVPVFLGFDPTDSRR